MKKYVTPFAEIFGMSCGDVETGVFFRASGDSHLDTIDFLDAFRIGSKSSGNAGSDEIDFGELQ